jgi:hypothetical protein
MKKEIKHDTIYIASRTASTYTNQFTWGEVKKALAKKGVELLDSDTLEIGFEAGDYSESYASDPTFYVHITREREETDEELSDRMQLTEEIKLKNLASRRAKYEELKKEFEG